MINNLNDHKYSGLDIGLLLFFVIIVVSPMKDPFLLSGWVMVILFVYQLWKKTLGFLCIDIGIVILWGYDLLLLFTTINACVSWQYIITKTVSIAYYFILRFNFRNYSKFKKLLYTYSIFVGILSLLGVFSFFFFSSSLKEVGWDNIYNFRFLFCPLGNIINVWGTLLLVFFVVVNITLFLYRKQQKAVVVLSFCLYFIVFGIITSFSRGIYIAFSFYLILLVLRVVLDRKRNLKKVLLVISLALIVSVLPYKKDIVQTFKMTETISQQRSLNSRVVNTSIIKDALMKVPFMGAGLGNYTLITNKYVFENDSVLFTSVPPNIFVQLLAEKGIIGFLLWGGFGMCLCRFFIKHHRNKLFILLGGSFVMLLVREASFPIFLENQGFQILVLTVLAFSQNFIGKKEKVYVLPDITKKYILVLFLLLFIGFYIGVLNYFRNELHNGNFLCAVKEKKYKLAQKEIEKTDKVTPYLINRSLLYYTLGDRQQAELYMREALDKNPLDIHIQFYLALILEQRCEKDSAQIFVDNLVQNYPSNFIYQLGASYIYYNHGKMKHSMSYLLRAIELSPRVMETSFFKKNSEELFNKIYINDHLANLKNELIHDPVQFANRGKILLMLGDTLNAEKDLKMSISKLPNLIYPWYSLGVIELNRNNIVVGNQYLKCFMRLAFDSFLSEEKMEEYISTGKIFEKVEGRPLCDVKYESKFKRWYGSELLSLEIDQVIRIKSINESWNKNIVEHEEDFE